ncbi:ArdC-like ssDNA-binding domain-containing protein [Butyrivibrio sp.]|uniref:ArdC-like ssDNA-binding domain-containing protein n=1 Tax=Butyrivibrio sp. TaxID=28121 RepID=UPI0025B8785B|nr:ArdC-like ssDNA-binding domain-containing protein [Butyrivibrio sp.]MBQ9301650.1 ImmA/IrrE family metallo-endopeptidase [Butyrivibrio sp.]
MEREDRLKQLTDQLTDGVKAVRDSGEYKKLLAVMAKFPHYSMNNCMLIAMQRPDATLCQGFDGWKKMGRYVKKGEKGIKIIAPAPYTVQKEVDKLDSNGKPVIDSDGEHVKETKEYQVMGFKAETTFDVSQTDGKELPKIGVDELKGEVDRYELMMGVLKDLSPVPIGFEDIQSGAKGHYHTTDKRIAIQKDMSELQTVKTCLHEITHAMLHADAPKEISKNRKELEAEGTACIVLKYMGYDTDAYSFPYLTGYTTDADMKELKDSLNTIRRTSSKIITKIENELSNIYMERHPEIVPDNEPVKTKKSVESDTKSEKETETVADKTASDNHRPDDDWPLVDEPKEKVIAERRILGTVRILPDGAGGKKPSLLDSLKVEKEKIKNKFAGNGGRDEKGVAI